MKRGWFSDRDADAPYAKYPWRPYLQLDGMCLSLDNWFRTEEECDAFLRTDVIGQGMWPG